MTKLPKQWLNWARKNKLKIAIRHASSFRGFGPHYLRNNTHLFMAGGNGFSVALIEGFDRWANSRLETVPTPQTGEEFTAAIKSFMEKYPASPLGGV